MPESNVVALVDKFVKSEQENRDVRVPDDVAFETFAARTVLRDENVSDDEVEIGRIGGGQDGAIDAAYTFLDGSILDEDSEILGSTFDPSNVRKGATIRLCLVQAKRSKSFSETALDKVQSNLNYLIQLNRDDENLRKIFSQDLLERTRVFTDAWSALSIRSPHVEVDFVYATRGDVNNVSPAVKEKAQSLERHVSALIPGAEVEVKFVGAQELWELASSTPAYDLQLKLEDYVSKGDSHTGIVSLEDYFSFLTDESGGLRGYLFDLNVRDYQGGVTVNRKIYETLSSDSSEDFWWLNNGVTILCSNVSIGGGKTFTLESVQIVNGMQTSQTIYEAFSASHENRRMNGDKSLLVRIIKTNNDETRDKVIRATNSQTKIPDASLHATEEIHRKIESFFLGHGWFYDRRKNFYKNMGKPAGRIVGIPALGQAMMAIGLSRPDAARARPSTLLNNDEDYTSVFDPALSLDVYLWVAKTQRRVDALLGSEADSYTRTNSKYYVSMFIVSKASKRKIVSPFQLVDCSKTAVSISSEDVRSALYEILQEARKIEEEKGWKLDRAAKSSEFKQRVVDRALEG